MLHESHSCNKHKQRSRVGLITKIKEQSEKKINITGVKGGELLKNLETNKAVKLRPLLGIDAYPVLCNCLPSIFYLLLGIAPP